MSPEQTRDAGELEVAASIFERVRPRLFGVAYRMLGSAAEAEDVVQDAWLRWQATDRNIVQEPAAFLTTVTTRLAINVAQSARSRREAYIGPWLPEPVDTSADPQLGAERGEALEFAVLLLLEKLSAKERAAYVLREAFDYSHEQIAEVLEVGEANARQLVSRARKHVDDERRVHVGPAERSRLLHAFLAAARAGDIAALENLFVEDIVSTSDGGGAVNAARIPVVGRARVARFIAAFASKFWEGTDVAWIEANGQTSLLLSRGETVLALLTVDASDQGIDQIRWVMNPAKLATLSHA